MSWIHYIPTDPLVWLYMLISFIVGAVVGIGVLWAIAEYIMG